MRDRTLVPQKSAYVKGISQKHTNAIKKGVHRKLADKGKTAPKSRGFARSGYSAAQEFREKIRKTTAVKRRLHEIHAGIPKFKAHEKNSRE